MPPENVSSYDSSLQGSPFIEEFKALIRYRDLIVQMVSRNIKTRYKRSVLGVLWTMINPLMMTFVLALVFSNLFRTSVPHYTVYLLTGIIAWNFFQQVTTHAMSELVWGGGLLNRIYMPKTIFAASALGTGLINLFFSLIPLFIVMAFTRTPFRPSLLFLPISILLLVLFTIGIGLLLSTLSAGFTDVFEMYQIIVTAWYFLTPILYPLDIISPEKRGWFALNPMYPLIEVFRQPIHSGTIPGLKTIASATLVSLVALLIGWWSFTRKADQLAYRV